MILGGGIAIEVVVISMQCWSLWCIITVVVVARVLVIVWVWVVTKVIVTDGHHCRLLLSLLLLVATAVDIVVVT